MTEGAGVKRTSWAATILMSESTGDGGSGQTVGSPQYDQAGSLCRRDRYLPVDADWSTRWGEFLPEMVSFDSHDYRKLKEELFPAESAVYTESHPHRYCEEWEKILTTKGSY